MPEQPATSREVAAILKQLESFSPIDDLPSGSLAEVGLAEDDEGLKLLAFAPGATDAWLLDNDRERRALLPIDEGLLRVTIPWEAPPRYLTVQDEPPIELPQAIGGKARVQGLDLIRQALELGNVHEAVARLRGLGGEQGQSPVRARLALDAAQRLEGSDDQGQDRPIGACDAIVSWRDWCGLVRVRALVRGPDSFGAARLDPDLVGALERGGQQGHALGQRMKGSFRERAMTPAVPEIEATTAVAQLRDPGGTIALAAALAACSMEIGRPLARGVLAVGAIDDNGRLLPVDRQRLASVLETLGRERPGAKLVLPAQGVAEARAFAGSVELLPATTLDEAAQLALGDATCGGLAPPELAHLLDDAEVDERAHRPAAAIEKARRFLETGQGTKEERLRGLWIEGACLVHLGRPDEGHGTFERARELLRELAQVGQLDRRVAVYLALAEAEAFSDLYRYADALAAVEHGRVYADGYPPLQSKLDAFQGFVLIHAGRADEALALLWKACPRALPADAPRFHCWLSAALTETGELAEALDIAQRGLGLAEWLGGDAAAANRAYLCLAQARAHLRRLCPREALFCAEAGLEVARTEPGLAPYPLSGLRHARGAALLLLGRVEEGLSALEDGRGRRGQPLIDLVVGMADLERARALLEREPVSSRAAEALARAREVVSAYGPARSRFSRELDAMERPGRGATPALAAVLRAIKY